MPGDAPLAKDIRLFDQLAEVAAVRVPDLALLVDPTERRAVGRVEMIVDTEADVTAVPSVERRHLTEFRIALGRRATTA
jgi:hypothetical protein